MRDRYVAGAALGFALLSVTAQPVAAQRRPHPVIEVSAGAYNFPDDGAVVREGFVGGGARFYVSPRVSIGPDVVLISGQDHSHLIATGNLTFDFLRQTQSGRGVTPFVVVGGGLYQTREDLLGRGTYTSSEGAFTAGGGVRARVGRRATVGAEARIGWEAHIRVNAVLGIALGGS